MWIGVFVLVYAVLFKKEMLKIDYFLLITFVFFFGFTDNLSHILKINLTDGKSVFLYSAFLSQIISNVPATLFLADFTQNWKSLLWGVSVGRFGNLIGSLATLIAYKLYSQKYRQSLTTLIKFHIYGYLFFFIGVVMFLLKGFL